MTAPHDPTTGEATPENVEFPEIALRAVENYLRHLADFNTIMSAAQLRRFAEICHDALESHRQLRDRYLTEKAAWRASQSTELPAVPPTTDGGELRAPLLWYFGTADPKRLVEIWSERFVPHGEWKGGSEPTTDGDAATIKDDR